MRIYITHSHTPRYTQTHTLGNYNNISSKWSSVIIEVILLVTIRTLTCIVCVPREGVFDHYISCSLLGLVNPATHKYCNICIPMTSRWEEMNIMINHKTYPYHNRRDCEIWDKKYINISERPRYFVHFIQHY